MNKKKEAAWGFLMIAPNTIGLGVFFVYPLLRVFWDSLHDIGAFNGKKWCGLQNYVELFQDEVMWQCLANTFKYVILILPMMVILSLILAVFLNSGIRGSSFFRVVYFIPAITMSTAVAMVWAWIYNRDNGLINIILNALGFDSVVFLTNPKLALPAVAVVALWGSVGYNMVILLAGLQGIDRGYYEAASIDGANGIDNFFHITLPLVSPSLFFVILTSTISIFQIFNEIVIMIGNNGSCIDETQSMITYFYRNAFLFSNKGYASAIAVLLFVIIMIFSVIQMIGQKKWVNY